MTARSSRWLTIVLIGFCQSVAFAVDTVPDEQEVLVKPLRAPLSRVRNIAGATVLGSGHVVPILNVSDLLKSARKAGNECIETILGNAGPHPHGGRQPAHRVDRNEMRNLSSGPARHAAGRSGSGVGKVWIPAVVAVMLRQFRQGHPRLLREHLHGVEKPDALLQLEKLEDVAAHAAAEALEEALVVDVE